VFSAGVPRIVGPVLKAMSSLRILIVDDHEAVRNGVRTLLASSTHWSVCGEASDGVEAVEKAKRLYPDVVLMDVSMPRMDGIEATRIIRREVPESDVIIVSQNDPVLMQKVAVEAGAKAFVEKSRIAQDLLRVIEALGKNGGGVIGNRQSDRTADSSAPVNLVKVRGTELLASDTRERYRQKIARITLDSMVQFVGLLDHLLVAGLERGQCDSAGNDPAGIARRIRSLGYGNLRTGRRKGNHHH
jgi:DNA-binding NarL/FixJ family response regulator